ncbi:ferritin-like domain-containing protein [Embleya sp. AB8]|uniref:ferritin-like domain-containing protein n=1 Tax=Embleya sp. AB8 TaxID=3156304 RepID=UPI003C774215
MSVFDLPRLHFAGTATTQLPTGPRSGLVDLATNTALTPDGRPFPTDRPAVEYHEILRALGPDAGAGANFGGNGHFTVDAVVVGAERRPGVLLVGDPVIGRSVDMWGHYNAYFATTANRARVFDVDPSSNWTTTLMIGQLAVGRLGRSHDVGYLFTGDVEGFQPPRWQEFAAPPPDGTGAAASRLPLSTVHQFVVAGDASLHWPAQRPGSPVVEHLREVLAADEVHGLVVQFALWRSSAPPVPEHPTPWRLHGTIAPWRGDELRSYPAGRLLTAAGPAAARPLTVAVDPTHVTFNLVGAAGQRRDEDWELRTAHGDRPVAELPRDAAGAETAGVVVVPRRPGSAAAEHEALLIRYAGTGAPVWREREVNVQTDDACLILDHPDDDPQTRVVVRSLIRGRPGPVDAVQIRQFFNPRALPRDQAARSPEALCTDLDIVRVRPDRDCGWRSECVIRTDDRGRGTFEVRGARPGCARILLTPPGVAPPVDPSAPGSAAVGYDNDDRLGYWAGAGEVSVRILPDDRRLDALPPEGVSFELVYTEIFAFYELAFSFMKDEVFSMADRFRVDTYVRLIWQMSDPRNKAKTYYMPPTRELSAPQARLLLAYLRARGTPDRVLTAAPVWTRPRPVIATRAQLVSTLRHAALIELAVTLQYLYAAYSLPLYGAGLEYVRRQVWTPERLRVVCGDGGETLDDGIRSTLLRVAREEMIHFLVVNNILAALGEPFHFPAIDFARLECELLVPLDFALEALDVAGVQRFITIERPERLREEVAYGDEGRTSTTRGGHTYPYTSLSGLYADVRAALVRIPDLFVLDRGQGGGEHHVFLRESVNTAHPDYQLRVDDLSSALFAIDFVTEQGEGRVLDPAREPAAEESHFDAFERISDLLMTMRLNRPPGRRPAPDVAYPVLRNPTLAEGTGNRQVITEPTARRVARLCNDAYRMMAQLMVQHFGEAPTASLRRSELMNVSIDVMNGALQPLAELLAVLPSGMPGRTAGAPFALGTAPQPIAHPEVARRVFAARCTELAGDARRLPLVPDRVGETFAFLADRFRAH